MAVEVSLTPEFSCSEEIPFERRCPRIFGISPRAERKARLHGWQWALPKFVLLNSVQVKHIIND